MWKLFSFISTKYKILALLGVTLVFLGVITDLLVPSMLGGLTQTLSAHYQPVKPGITPTVDIVFIYKDWIMTLPLDKSLLVCSLMMVGFSVAGIIFGLVSVYIGANVAVEVAKVTRNNLFKKIQGLSASNIAKFGTSSLITRLTNDIVQVQTIWILMLGMMVRAPFLFIGGLIFSLLTSPSLSISLAVMIPTMLVVIVICSIKVIPLFTRNQQILDSINKVSRENILGVRVVKSFNLEEIQNGKFNVVNDEWQKVSTKAFTILNILIPIITFITNLAMMALIIIAKETNNFGTNESPNIDAFNIAANVITFSQYLGYVTGGLIMTVMVLVLMLRSRISAVRINQVLNEKEDIKLNDSNVFIEKPSIKFENVSFAFNKGAENALTNINFDLKEGQTLGIIGPTGSGKSTIINLLSRIYETTEGSIYIDGKNVNEINSQNLNDSIGQVLQESILFSGTIKSNLLFGKLDATDEEIDKATMIACARPFIESFDDKYNHVVEQRGKNLSGGQKQRLQIARAILRQPKILVLDDSTSALDALTDRTLRSNIKKYMKGTTTIIIAQKINSIKDADKIIVLDDGNIVGQGKHSQLIKSCALYKDIANSQLSKEEQKNV